MSTTTRRFHINPKTGNPNVCSAKPGRCPFGENEPHFDTKAEALSAYEKRMTPETFARSEKPLDDGFPLHGESDYRLAPVGTIVEFDNGYRFVKTQNDTWESSQNGGVIHDDATMGALRENDENARVGRVVNENQRTKAKNSGGSIRATLLQQGSYEKGRSARKYFLLLNHRDPEMVAALDGKVEDQQVIDTVKKANEAEKVLHMKKKQLDRAIEARDNAKTDAQRAGYIRVVETKSAEFNAAQRDFEQMKYELDQHMKRYAKQYVLHYRSLDSLERIVANGARSNPPGLRKRIAYLEDLQRTNASIKPVDEELSSGDPQRILKAARMVGDKGYIRNAKDFADASARIEQIEKREHEIRKLTETESPRIKEAAHEDLLDLQFAKQEAINTRDSANEKLALFRDDIRDRLFMETALDREITALKTMGGLD